MKKKFLVALAAVAMLGLVGCGKTGYDTYAEYADKYVELGEYTGIEYTRNVVEVTDDEVQSQLDSFVSSLTTSEEVTDRTVENGDTVNIDYVGTIDGEEFEGGTAEGSSLTIGSGQFIDDFEDQLVGANIGDKVTVEVTFPDPYDNNPDMAGKDAEFAVTVNSISVSVVPELNDQLIADNTDYDTIDDYKTYITESMTESKQADADSAVQSDILTAIIDNCTYSGYPEDESTKLVDDALEQTKSQAESYGIDFETYLSYVGYTTEDDYKKVLEEYAVDFLKEKMTICAIAKKENMKVTDDEIEEYVNKLVEDYGLESSDDVYEYYTEEDIAYFVVSEKVMDFLNENAVEVDSTEATTEAE